MVGVGVLGCEFFKNFVFMGVVCGLKGSFIVIDDDVIEKSNFSR